MSLERVSSILNFRVSDILEEPGQDLLVDCSFTTGLLNATFNSLSH